MTDTPLEPPPIRLPGPLGGCSRRVWVVMPG